MEELDRKAVGARIRTFNQRHIGIEERELAKEAKQSKTNLSLIINGHRAPNDEILTLLSQKYKANLDWIMFGKGPEINNHTEDPQMIANLHAKVVSLEMQLAEMKLILNQVLTKLG